MINMLYQIYLKLRVHTYFNVLGLPDVPTGVTVTEGRRRKTNIHWKSKNPFNKIIIYIVEERHHTGEHFVESRMGDWTPCLKSTKTNAGIRNIIKPGRWYQFRVAAVNENGTRGFSEPSPTFIASISNYIISEPFSKS